MSLKKEIVKLAYANPELFEPLMSIVSGQGDIEMSSLTDPRKLQELLSQIGKEIYHAWRSDESLSYHEDTGVPELEFSDYSIPMIYQLRTVRDSAQVEVVRVNKLHGGGGDSVFKVRLYGKSLPAVILQLQRVIGTDLQRNIHYLND
jgi:hypothetical protein